ncbi:hypothetical protein SFA35_17270 [Pseudomonas sp. HR96]|uniref:hypothetical protein n=1 Tax=Pseudomonas sp. HR96 TaxID=1027966 RepID=UPI002A76018E|nr:hypothetical protein [Pseudomonas sp. HR96]WPO98386.1 hypothetical protein SFA35_17270 [Pseudomonas sp. HR96]
MTPERFAQLSDAYGANLQRWPSAERSAAQALLATGDPQLQACLSQAGWLDRRLDAYQVPAPSPALVRSIAAGALAARSQSFWSRYGAWLSRVSFVGAGLAGLATGMLVVALNMPIGQAPGMENEALPSVFDHSDLESVYAGDTEESEQ